MNILIGMCIYVVKSPRHAVSMNIAYYFNRYFNISLYGLFYFALLSTILITCLAILMPIIKGY